MALFGKRSEPQEQAAATDVYTLLGSDSRPLARATRHEFESPFLFFTLIEGELRSLREAQGIQVIPPPDMDQKPQIARYAGYHDGIVALQPIRGTGSAMRENFRVPADFDSHAYPDFSDPVEIHAVDLSCGGIAFRSSHPFSPKEIFEVDIPLTSGKQLVLRAQALRARTDPKGGAVYACRFVDLTDDAEMLLRETMFVLQFQSNQFQNR